MASISTWCVKWTSSNQAEATVPPAAARAVAGDAERAVRVADRLRHLRPPTAGEKAAVSAQKLGQIQPFIAVFPQECMGQLASFWANLKPFSLRGVELFFK